MKLLKYFAYSSSLSSAVSFTSQQEHYEQTGRTDVGMRKTHVEILLHTTITLSDNLYHRSMLTKKSLNKFHPQVIIYAKD